MGNKNLLPVIIGILILFLLIITPVLGSGNNYSMNISSIQPIDLLKGDPIVIPFAPNDSKMVQVWVFGQRFFTVQSETLSVNASEYIIEPESAGQLHAGRYVIIMQSPGKDLKFDIVEDNQTHQWINRKGYDAPRILFTDAQAENELGDDEANSLIESLNNPVVDDNYTISIFNITDSFITVNPVQDHHVGDPITISGTTNVPAGETVSVQLSQGFLTDKVNTTGITTQGGLIKVQPGTNGVNFYSLSLNSNDSIPAHYFVYANTCAFNRGCSQVATSFNLFERQESAPTSPTVTTNLTLSRVGTPISQIPMMPKTTSKPAPISFIIPFIALGIIGSFFVFKKKY